MKILVVDDEQVIRDLLTQLLHMKGHEVALGVSGQEAVSKAQAEAFDLIFMDIMMPDMDGVEALKQIRRQSSSAIVVMMTGFAVEEKIREAMAEGAFEFLYKPFNIMEVTVILDKLLKRKGLKPVESKNK